MAWVYLLPDQTRETLTPDEGESITFGDALVGFGVPALISALVIYRLARRWRIAWAIGAAIAIPVWYLIYLVVAASISPD